MEATKISHALYKCYLVANNRMTTLYDEVKSVLVVYLEAKQISIAGNINEFYGEAGDTRMTGVKKVNRRSEC